MARSTSCSISGNSRHSAMSIPLDGESSIVSLGGRGSRLSKEDKDTVVSLSVPVGD